MPTRSLWKNYCGTRDERERRDWRDARDGNNEGGDPLCPRRAFLACLALHTPRSVALAALFSILLGAISPAFILSSGKFS